MAISTISNLTGDTPTFRTGTPTAGVSEWRYSMFPISPRAALDTKYGEVRFESGRLTARHRDYFDSIMCEKEKAIYHDPSKQLIVMFDAAKVMKLLKFKPGSNYRILYDQLIYIQSVVLSVRKIGDNWPTSFSLITSIGDAKDMTHHGRGQYDTKMKKLVLSPGAVNLLFYDTHMFVNKAEMRNILTLENQISRSIMRWCYTHSNKQNHNLLDVFGYVGIADCSDRMIRRYFQQLREDQEAMKAGGVHISIEARTLHYPGQHDGVFISSPKPKPNEILTKANTTEPIGRGEI